MADNSNGWHFKKGLDEDFMKKLKSLAEQGGWFADVLADPDLILGIRKNYMNVYWRGQSLFKIERKNGLLKFSTHPKYLIDPGLSKAVVFTGLNFQVDGHQTLAEDYRGPETLGRMKQAARPYVKDEKKGVHAVMRANLNVVDTEIAFNSEAEDEKEPLVPRIDLACLEKLDGKIQLRFWEAKLYDNPELRAEKDKEAPVVEQVRRYSKLIDKHRGEIVDSYHEVACNLAEMACWITPARKIGELVDEAANGAAVSIDKAPSVGLIVYDYDGADKDNPSWKAQKKKLQSLMPVLAAGKAKDIRLHWTSSN